MQLSQLRHFLAVVDSGSIRGAARRLGLSQPALTRSLRLLEVQLDTVLLRRSSRGVDLTEAGRLLLVRARNVHREVANAEQELAELGGRGSSAVSIGIASVIGALLVPGTIERFHARRPDGHLRIVEGTQETLLPQLREGSLNLAACLRLDSESTAGFRVKPLAKLRLVVVGRKGHPLRHAGSLAALRDAQWLMIRPPGRRGMLEHAYSLEGQEIPPRTVQCDSQGIQIAILAVERCRRADEPANAREPIGAGVTRGDQDRPAVAAADHGPLRASRRARKRRHARPGRRLGMQARQVLRLP